MVFIKSLKCICSWLCCFALLLSRIHLLCPCLCSLSLPFVNIYELITCYKFKEFSFTRYTRTHTEKKYRLGLSVYIIYLFIQKKRVY